MDDLNHLAKALMTLDDRLVNCNHCGLCQSVCPMYAETMLEGDLSRGKLALVEHLAHKMLDDAEAVSEKLSRCLLCGGCQHVCPSGVDTFALFLDARAILYGYLGLSPLKKALFRALLPNPRLLNLLLAVGTPFRKLVMSAEGNAQNTACAPMLSPLLGQRHLPNMPEKPLHTRGAINTPAGKSRLKVAFFPGCMGDKVYTNMAEACLKVFDHHEVGVFLPTDFACCGLPSLASGDTVGFEKMMAQNVEAFKKGSFDYIVTPCPSCTMTIRDLWVERSGRMPAPVRDAVNELATKAIDINAFMIDVLKVRPGAVLPGNKTNKQPVTYHEPCHLHHSLRISAQPRALLRMHPGVELVEMKQADHCCGCGGSFTLTHPDLSTRIGSKKVAHVEASGAEVVATACPACMMQISDQLARKKSGISVKHVVEIYADSLK